MRKSIGLLNIAAAFTLLCVMHSASTEALAQKRLSVTIPAEVSLEGPTVELGAIASINGPAESARRIGAVSLGYAPNIGAFRVIRRDQIKLGINAAGFSETEVTVESPDIVIVRRTGRSIAGSTVKAAIESLMVKTFSSTDVEVRFLRLEVPESTTVPVGAVELVPDASGVRNLFAPFSIPIQIRINGLQYKTISAAVEIEAFANALVASSEIPADSTITARDVHTERIRLTQPLSGFIRDPSALHGKILSRLVRAGEPVRNELLIGVAMIKQGDIVKIETETAGLNIVVTGEARSAGKIGDRIAVRNQQSGAIIQAVVIDTGRVKVLF